MLSKSKIILGFYAENKLFILLTLMISLFSNVFTIVIPVSIGKYYSLVFGFNANRSQVLNFLPKWFWETVPQFLSFFICLILLKIVFDFLRRFWTARIGEQLLFDLRRKLFEAQLIMPQTVYDKKGIGKYLLRHSGDLKSVQNYVTKGIIGFLVDSLLIVFVLITLGMLDLNLLMIIIGFLPILGGAVYLMNRELHLRSLAHRNYKAGLLSFVNARLRSILSIKAFNRHVPEVNRYELKSNKVFRAGIKYHFIRSAIMALIPGLLYMMLFVILYYVYYQYTLGENGIGAGPLLTAILLLITTMPVFRRIVNVNTVWELGNISFAKLLLILNEPKENDLTLAPFRYQKGEIVLEHVAFRYPEAAKNIIYQDMRLGADQLSRIVGGTGSGKTTFIKLLLGIYPADEGKIWIDRQQINQVAKKSLRKSIAVVPENWPLTGNTVFQAISYSRKVSKKQEAKKVLAMIQKAIPEEKRLTLDTKIGDLGSNLSKGQQKLLAYARALLANKPLLVIDEPFSGLDTNSRQHIAALINNLKGKKTIIILDHDNRKEVLEVDNEFRLLSTKHHENEEMISGE